MKQTYKANGKINLVLNVYDKLDNNYHEVEFIMAPINLYDEIIISTNDQLEVWCDGKLVDDNLVNKACALFSKKTNTNILLKIEINKHLPIGGGVGGGSSDASCVLKALNDIYHTNLTTSELEQMASKIGSDCPFFIQNRVAIATGHGEVIQPINKNISTKVILVNPLVELSTQQVFSNYHNTNNHGDINQFINHNNWYDYLHNDLTHTSCELEPIIKTLLNDLHQYGFPVLMSGSGASCFMIINNPDINTELIIEDLSKKYPYVKECEVVNEFK